MTDDDQSVDEISGWRELLDGMGQLTIAWEAVVQSRAEEPESRVRLPDEMLASITRAAHQAADALAGLAELLAEQDTATDELASVADTQHEAADGWSAAHDAAAG